MADGERYLLKPMNCPHHIKIYQSKPRSYRDLPLRLAEFGTVYRFEQSGELNGMTRVRGFTQDDAHLFCTEEQVADEFRGCVEMTQFVLKTLGLDDYRVRLGFPRSGQRQVRGQRRDVAAGRGGVGGGLPRDEPAERGGRSGARRRFTGRRPISSWPTASGREWQLGTVQLDYNLPSAGAVRPGIHRAGQPAAPAGDDPPGAVRVVRAVRGDADRAFCRGLSALAGPGAGPGAGR